MCAGSSSIKSLRTAKLARMHFIIIAIVVLCLWGVWRLIRAQIEKGGDQSTGTDSFNGNFNSDIDKEPPYSREREVELARLYAEAKAQTKFIQEKTALQIAMTLAKKKDKGL